MMKPIFKLIFLLTLFVKSSTCVLSAVYADRKVVRVKNHPILKNCFQVIRYNADSTKDISFAISGSLNLQFDIDTRIKDIKIQNCADNEKIIFLTEHGNNEFFKFISFFRLNHDGTHDIDFKSKTIDLSLKELEPARFISFEVSNTKIILKLRSNKKKFNFKFDGDGNYDILEHNIPRTF